LTARRVEVLRELAESLNSGGGQVEIMPGNVVDRQQMKAIALQIEQQFAPVDVLVANAGTHVPTVVEEFDTREYDSIMQINFSGALYCIEAVLPSMIERKKGHLVGVSSVAGYRGLPQAAAYGASKAALTHFLESIRFDLEQYNIAVSVVSPGFVRTPLTDKNEFDMPFRIEADEAAEHMLRGIERKSIEIHFPWKFTYIMKFMRIIPYQLYHHFIMSKVVGS